MNYKYSRDALVTFLLLGLGLGLLVGMVVSPGPLAKLFVTVAMFALGAAAGIWYGHKVGRGG